MRLSSLVAEGHAVLEAKYQQITPNKVSADIKKGLGGAAAGKYQPKLGNVKFGVNASKLSPFMVLVSPEYGAAKDKSSAEIEAYWSNVLDALVNSGYTLVANAMSSDSRIIGGPEAKRVALQTQIVAVTKQAATAGE